MKLSKARTCLLLLCTMLLLHCKKPYFPQVKSESSSLLVVEGVITGMGGTTTIKLSRTRAINDTNRRKPELQALVYIESDKQGKYTLSDDNKGNYTLANTTLPAGQNYRLHINTADGKEYASDYVPMKITPPIDSLSYEAQGGAKADGNGIRIYVNTHDATNTTRYYRWEYNESWNYTSIYRSNWTYKNHQITTINDPDSIRWVCYRFFTPSNGIYVGNTTKLSQDVISHQPMQFVYAKDGKLTITYSVQVIQYAITEEAYNYWQELKRNTEQVGGIFDSQPSALTGNVHCLSNASETVLGYISASSVTSMRMFVNGYKLPFYATYVSANNRPPQDSCKEGSLPIEPKATFDLRAERALQSGQYLLYDQYWPRGAPEPISYLYALKECVDCRLKGGTTVKPSYWP